MLFVEYIAPLTKASQADKCLCALSYLKRDLKIEVATIPQIRNLLERARVIKKKTKINYTRALSSLGEKVDSPANGMWQITPTGEMAIRELLGLPMSGLESENDTATLKEVIKSTVTDEDVAVYIQEGLDCLEIGKLRAVTVFLWSGAVHMIRTKLFAEGIPKLNASLRKFDPKSREIKRLDDFAYIKDSILLSAMYDLSLCDKSEKDILEQCLDLRNKCGHPGKYSPGPKRISGFIEDLVSIVFV